MSGRTGADFPLRHAADAASRESEVIEVKTGGQGWPEDRHTEAFEGRWLVCPDSDGTRTGEEGDHARLLGRRADQEGPHRLYVAHCNEGFAPSLEDYDSLDGAAKGDLPDNILAIAKTELGEPYAIWRDI